MIKFKTDLDRKLFLTDIGRFDLVESASIETSINEEMVNTFLKSRKKLTTGAKSFRMSQQAKLGWRRTRFSHMKGIKTFHKSTEGKRFHRSLGRFLATRLSDKNEDLDLLYIESVKSASSVRTNYYSLLEYYMSVEDQVNLELLLEYSMPLVMSMESKILARDYESITEDELEAALRLVDESEMILAISEVLSTDRDLLNEEFMNLSVDEDLTYGCSIKYLTLLDKTDKINNLYNLMESTDDS